MSRLSTNVPTVRQRQQARAPRMWGGTPRGTVPPTRLWGGIRGTVPTTTIGAPFALGGGFGLGQMFARTQPGLGQQAAAARYGATGLAGPTYESMAGGPAEPGQTGMLPNFATLKAMALGTGRNSAWARQKLRRWAAGAQARLGQAEYRRSEAERARRRGDVLSYIKGSAGIW